MRDFVGRQSANETILETTARQLYVNIKANFDFFSFICSPIRNDVHFSAIFFHNGLDSWFNERNQVVLKESINIANSYLEEHKKKAIHDCSVITKSIEYYIDNIDKFPGNKRQQFVEIGHILDEICRIREVNAAIVMDSILRVVAHSRYSTALHFLNFYYSEVQNLKKAPHRTKIIETADNDTIAAMSYFSAHGENMYLLIEKKVDPHIFIYAQHAQRSYQDYLQMYHERGSLEIAFVFIFLIVGILMLVSSISIAVVFSWRIVNPVSNLIDVAEKSLMEISLHEFREVKRTKKFSCSALPLTIWWRRCKHNRKI